MERFVKIRKFAPLDLNVLQSPCSALFVIASKVYTIRAHVTNSKVKGQIFRFREFVAANSKYF